MYIGYSARTYTHRYTRWFVVAVDGTPSWEDVAGEELYEEIKNVGAEDDYDKSELVNLLAHPGGAPSTLLGQMRAVLKKGFPQPPPQAQL